MASSSNEAKVALITGGSSGIGEATAKLLLKKGYKVAISGSRKEKIDRVLAECSQLSPHKFQPLGIVADFNEPTNGKVVVEKALEHFGRLDVLINNAGVFSKGRVDDGGDSYEKYRRIMAINLDATVSATFAAVEALKKSKGQIIFISSTASVKAFECGYAYCAAKAAMSHFARCVAIDLARQVRVNTISPGPVVTDIFKSVGLEPAQARAVMGHTTLEGRAGEPEEIAEAVEYVLGAQMLSGSEMFIEGGLLLKSSEYSVNAQVRQAVKKD